MLLPSQHHDQKKNLYNVSNYTQNWVDLSANCTCVAGYACILKVAFQGVR